MSTGSAFARVIGLTRSLSPFEREATEALQPQEPASVTQETIIESEVLPPEPVTVGTAEIVALPVAKRSGELVPVEAMRETVTESAIMAIEADIASLLATLEQADNEALAEAEEMAQPQGDEPEQATLTLLGELDRLWRADPMVATPYLR